MRPFAILTVTFLVLAITPAYADTVEVTFTGTVTSLPFGPIAPVVGVTVGDPFTAVLTYDENQPDLNPAPDIGHYFDYTFGLAVHTSSGDVIVPGSTIAPIEVSNDDVNADRVHNAASAGDTAHFDFSDSSMAAVSSDALSEVNWQVLLTLSNAQVAVRAFNAAVIMVGNITSLEVVRTVEPDTTSPQTTITGGPSGTITETNATFTFTGTDDVTPVANLVYSSRLDPLESTFSAFSSSTSRSYSNLALDDYTFHVKARDQAGNEDSTPATRSFTVSEPPDTTPPETTIVSGPSGSITETGATFTFTGSDDVTSVGNLVYASRLDPLESSFTSFSSSTSRSYSDLAPNDYTFQVKARDEAGNEASPATQSFTVTEEQEEEDTTPPQTFITSGPSGTVTRSSATFTFSGSDNITPIGRLVYASQLVPLEQTFSTFSNSNSRTFTNLAPGDYTFRVRAQDEAGHQDPSPATQSFTVDARILVANFMNGNNELFNSRIYFWNPSDTSAPITVRVFTLPLTGASTLLGTVDLGNLEATSARIIKLAEDILSPLATPVPYTDNGGNLTLEFTIVGENVRGVAQVFSSNLAFGTYPLQEIPSTPGASPTVLVANFLNGNNEALNSRVYLWNPSDSSAAITVRVFTLLRDGPSTLLGTVDLGLLESESARNIKVAEDILLPLELPLPYTDNGGNVTIEFTVGAGNVRGVAQVFSSDLAFGTYPMQVIP